MKTRRFVAVVVTLFMLSGTSTAGQGFGSFLSESDNATKALGCHDPGVTAASGSFGALYGCIQGRAETVKWFINGVPNTHHIENVKLMWNDWSKDRGYGVHADMDQAGKALASLIKMYAPEKGQELEEAFWGNEDKTIQTIDFVLKYTFFRGPAIDERLIVVTAK
jgi:hypothetical protein